MRHWLKGLGIGLLAVWLQAAADAIEDGFEAYKREAWEEAYGHWIRAAEAGNSEAQFYVSRLFAEGRGIPQDAVQSMRWLNHSARGGFPPAQFNLGNSYRTGTGVRRDLSQTIRWWTEAANAGFVQAQYNLALLYFRGDAGVRDLDQALAWAEKADEAGSREAAVLIGEIATIKAAQTAATAPAPGKGGGDNRPETADASAAPSDDPGRTPSVGPKAGTLAADAMNLAWVLDQPPDRFTLQVFSTRSVESAVRVRDMLSGDLASGVFPFVRDDGQWYGVVVGSLARLEEADAMKSRLPAALLETRPRVRSFGRVQGTVATRGQLADEALPRADARRETASNAGPGTAGTGEAGLNLAWVREQPPDSYTLQVFSTRSRESAQRVRRMVDADLPSAVFPFLRDDGRWYGVLVGAVARMAEAESLKGRLPEQLRESGPVVRSFGRVQATIETLQTAP